LSPKVEAALEDSGNQRFLCPISSMEVVRKWRTGRLPCSDPATWLDLALDWLNELRGPVELPPTRKPR
jgi:PIN domain nuclease of toxin-antitoxin system